MDVAAKLPVDVLTTAVAVAIAAVVATTDAVATVAAKLPAVAPVDATADAPVVQALRATTTLQQQPRTTHQHRLQLRSSLRFPKPLRSHQLRLLTQPQALLNLARLSVQASFAKPC